MNWSDQRFGRGILLVLPTMLMGCHPSTPPASKPLVVPTTLVSTDHFLGTALSGPTTGPVPSTQPDTALDVDVAMIAVEKLPAAVFTPLGGRASFISATGSRNAVLPAEELMSGVQVVDLKDPADFPAILRTAGSGRLTLITDQRGALPAGVTADFTASDPDVVIDPVTAAPVHLKLEVMVVRSIDTTKPARVALVVTNQTDSQPGTAELRTETALVDVSSAGRSVTGFTVPFRFGHTETQAVAIVVSIAPGSVRPEHTTAVTKAIAQISAHANVPGKLISNGQAGEDSTLSASILGLASPASRRASLAFLANQTGASLCEDMALEADDSQLAQLVTLAKLASTHETAQTISWKLDHAALTLLAKLLDGSNNGIVGAKLSDELAAVLTAHTGEVGRHPSSLDDVLAGARNRSDLDNRLIAENTIYLEDGSPASRVRAFDWLTSHGHAPAGYDPLANAKDRQAQLEHALNPPVTAPTTVPASGLQSP